MYPRLRLTELILVRLFLEYLICKMRGEINSTEYLREENKRKRLLCEIRGGGVCHNVETRQNTYMGLF